MKLLRTRGQNNTLVFFAICLITVLSFVTVMQAADNLWVRRIYNTDSNVFRYVGWLITEGAVPYRDTFDHKGPLLYILNAAGVYISYERGIWFVELFFIFVTYFVIYRIARLFANRFVSFISLIIVSSSLFGYFNGGNLSEEYAMPFIAVGIYTFLLYFKYNKVTRMNLILCGWSFGAVCLLRVNMITVWIVMCLACIIHCLYQKKVKELICYGLWFIIGIAIMAEPIMLWLFKNGSIQAFWEDYIVFNLCYISDPERAHIGSKIISAIAFLNDSVVLIVSGMLVYLCYAKRSFLNWSYGIYFFASFALISMSGQEYPHYGMVLVPAMIYPVAVFLDLCTQQSKRETSWWFGLVLFMAMLVVPEWLGAVSNTVGQYNNYYIPEDMQKMVEYIEQETTAEETIIVCGNENVIYNLSKRHAASIYSYQYPIAKVDKEIYQGFFRDLQDSMPEIIIITTHADFMRADIDLFISENQYEVVDMGIENHEIYRRCEK